MWARRFCVVGGRVAVAAGFAAAFALAADGNPASGGAPVQCEEDRAAGVAPTYSVRFNPKDNGVNGSAFAEAKARAAQYCVEKSCTVAGQSAARKPKVYGLGSVVRDRLIVGFSCVPDVPSSAAVPPDISFRLARPSEIDDALAKARAHCTDANAELADLFSRDGALIAVFRCGF
jgi:hypothetical protein